jgi:hypothetical protein
MAFLLGETLELAADVLELPASGPYDPLLLQQIGREIYDVLWNVWMSCRRQPTNATWVPAAAGRFQKSLIAALVLVRGTCRGQASALLSTMGGQAGTSTQPGVGGGPREVACARPAPGSPSVPEVAQELVGVLQWCRAGNRVACGGRIRIGAGRVPVQ